MRSRRVPLSWFANLVGFSARRAKRRPFRNVRLQIEELEGRVTPAALQTWLSGVGDDPNPGSRTAPNKTFAGALADTLPGGVISLLDSGGFGAVTIAQSVTIDG